MTDQQIVEALAKVMGWHKTPGLGWCWWDGSIEVREMFTGDFDPLHDYNHMALPRAKMREGGYERRTYDHNDCTEVVYYNRETHLRSSAMYTDELMAEALAILEAAGKEVDDGQS